MGGCDGFSRLMHRQHWAATKDEVAMQAQGGFIGDACSLQ